MSREQLSCCRLLRVWPDVTDDRQEKQLWKSLERKAELKGATWTGKTWKAKPGKFCWNCKSQFGSPEQLTCWWTAAKRALSIASKIAEDSVWPTAFDGSRPRTKITEIYFSEAPGGRRPVSDWNVVWAENWKHAVRCAGRNAAQIESLTDEEKSLTVGLEACGEGLKEELTDILCFAALILIALLEILQRGSRLRLPLSNFYSGIKLF